MLLWSVRFNTRLRARVCWRPENMLHHMLPAEPNCSHSTRQSIHSRQLKSNFHSMRLAPDCELGERGRRATSVGPSRTPLRQSGRARTTPYAHGHSAPTAALHCDRRGSAQPGLARPSSEPPAVMGSNKGLTRRSVQEGTAVEVQRPSGTRAMGCSFIGSYQSASGALPLCDPRPSGASGLFRASFYAFHWRGGDEVSSTSKPPLKGGKCVRP